LSFNLGRLKGEKKKKKKKVTHHVFFMSNKLDLTSNREGLDLAIPVDKELPLDGDGVRYDVGSSRSSRSALRVHERLKVGDGRSIGGRC
jgi:hypothetical protein